VDAEAEGKIVGAAMEMYGTHSFPGRLFIVEGIDGSGKSTQLSLLHRWLESEGYATVFSEWNSSPLVKKVTRRGKKKKLLTPMTFSLIHATDFADRTEHQIIPPLKAGSVVLADRYIYTAFARDVARGVDREWVRGLYGFAARPTVGFYFRVALDKAVSRLRADRAGFKYYEAGADVGFANDLAESFRLFQTRIIEEYERMVEEFGLVIIDASLPIEEQQNQMRKVVAAELVGAKKTRSNTWVDLASLARESHE
jgi:dTMP kinase